MAIFPVNVEGIRYATAQLVARHGECIYLMQIPGVPTTICLDNGKTLRNVRPQGPAELVYENLFLLDRDGAEHLFLYDMNCGHDNADVDEEEDDGCCPCSFTKVREAGPQRQIPMGVQRVAEEPQDEDFNEAAVYTIDLPADCSSLLSRVLLRIDYRGDVARLYANGRLIADNFYYGRPFYYGLWRLPEGTRQLELRILPLQANAPIYLPREADKTPGEQVKSINFEFFQ